MEVKNYKIILGSSSIWRKKVLTSLGYEFTTMSPDIDEKAIRHEDPRLLTLQIARAKSEALKPNVTEDTILITSDQVIVCNGEIREKPKNKEECRTFLRSYNSYPAECYSAVVVYNTKTKTQVEGVGIAVQYFKYITEELIESLIVQGDALNCAGGFVRELMTEFLDKLEGEEETVLGLPKTLTKTLITTVITNI